MGWRDWTGVGERRWQKSPDEEVQPGKTLWDWLQLLIVPAILIGVTFAWSSLQTSSDNAREDRRIDADNRREDRRIAADRAAAEDVRQDTTLNGYFQQMSDLILNKKLKSSKRGDVRSVARTVTLAAVRRLDGERRGEIVRFLYEADLILNDAHRNHFVVVDLRSANLAGADVTGGDLAVADLSEVDLTDAELSNTFLQGIVLQGANLTGANLRGAWLELAHGSYAILKGADLKRADLKGVDFSYANLISADLTEADIAVAVLQYANLTGANLRGANLADSDLRGAKLKRANLTGANLANALLQDAHLQDANLTGANLRGATLRRAHLAGANLDLGKYIAGLRTEKQKTFLHSEETFLDSLSPAELAKFNLTPKTLAKFRRANGG